MKKLLKVALVAICILSTGSFARAQVKIGYIAVDQVLQLMPETKTIRTQIDAYSKQFQDQIDRLKKESDDKIAAYQKGQATMTDAARIAAQGDINDVQRRTEEYRNTAEQSVQAKVQELIKPVNDKIRAAITAVAKEKGYTYVLNTSSPDGAEILVVMPETDDLMNAVKAKLGLTGGAPAAAAK